MNNYVKLSLVGIGFALAIGLNIYVDKLQAQTPPAITAPVPLPQINLSVTQAELDIISDGLQTQPFGKVVPLINKLREQLVAQQPKPIVPAVESKKE